MSVMKRLSLIFRSKANNALDKMEDPRETLDYSYQRQLELLQKVRRGVADVATSRKRVELQINQIEAQSRKLEEQGYRDLRNVTPNGDGTFSARGVRQDPPGTRRPGSNPEINVEIDASGNVRER